MIRIWVDGSATFNGSPNPKAGVKGDVYCSYVRVVDGKVVEEKCIPVGKGTANQGEYAAIIFALYRAMELGKKDVKIFSDSQVVSYIVNNRENIKSSKINGADTWTPLAHAFIDRHFDKCEVVWIPRQQNKLSHRVIARHQKLAPIVGIIDLLDLPE